MEHSLLAYIYQASYQAFEGVASYFMFLVFCGIAAFVIEVSTLAMFARARSGQRQINYNKFLSVLYNTPQFWQGVTVGALLMIEEGRDHVLFGLKRFLVTSICVGLYICSASSIDKSSIMY